MRGKLNPDAGSVQATGCIGYVPQEAVLGGTIQDSFSPTMQSWQINYALERVGLSAKGLDTRVKTLSGGQKTRLAFAIVLAQDPEPSLLLLDEPTNNLDASGLVWLVEIIRTFNGAVLLVSHDRQFVNSTANKIVELDNGKLVLFGGDYDFYREQKSLAAATEHARYQQKIDERDRLNKAITAQRDKGNNTHENIKRSDNDKYQRDFFRNRVTNKFGQQARALEKRLDQLQDLKKPESSKIYRVVLNGEVGSSKLVLRLVRISKGFPTPVFSNVSLELYGNERVHVQGKNGSGKTTLLSIAAGRSTPDRGGTTYGSNISIGYFSQDVDGLDRNSTGLDNLTSNEAHMTNIYREARLLGLGDTNLRKPVSELSRGQQAKLGFAKLLLGSHQLLILDEPTNHLDIQTREQIESALRLYRGAILFASHDKYFAKNLQPTKELKL